LIDALLQVSPTVTKTFAEENCQQAVEELQSFLDNMHPLVKDRFTLALRVSDILPFETH
jgi:hypothetical protein